MKVQVKLRIFVLSTVFASAFTQVQLRCNYINSNFGYTCSLKQALLVGDENQTVTFTGTHMSGKGNPHVVNLEISDSRVAFFSSKFFETFPGLTKISSMDSGLERITTTTFERATKLMEIFINSNDLNVLEARAFQNLTQLKTLKIHLGNISEIYNETFRKLSALEILSLYGMPIQTINENAFQDLKSVKRIDMTGNRLKAFPSKLFHPMISLEGLYLQNSTIEKLDGDLFLQNGANLKYIDLQNSKIVKISPNFIRNLVKLELLYMRGNLCFGGNLHKEIFPGNFTNQVHESLKKCYENYEASETTQSSVPESTLTVSTDNSNTKLTTQSTTLTSSTLPAITSTTRPSTNPPTTTKMPDLDRVRNFLMEFTGLFRIVDNKGNEIVKKNVEEILRF